MCDLNVEEIMGQSYELDDSEQPVELTLDECVAILEKAQEEE